MYNCINCDKVEHLYFECSKCNKKLCRKCVAPDNHICTIKKNNSSYELDMFCKDKNCIINKNLEICKFCKNKYCSIHIKNHKCIVKSCSIM